MTAQTAGHALVRAGHRVDRVVARGGVALRTGRIRRNMVRGLADVAREGGRGRVTAVAVARGRMALVEGCRGTRVARGGVRTNDHPEVLRTLVTGLAAGDAARTTGGGVARAGE